jgi:hypothetical protein
VKIVATAKALEMLVCFFEGMDVAERCMAVCDNDTLELGRVSLRFFTAPMVHWPEVMMTLDMGDMLGKMKDMPPVAPAVTIRSRMHAGDIPALRCLAEALAKA